MHRSRLLQLLLLLRWLHGGAGDDGKKEVLVREVVLDSAVVDIVYLGKSHECVLVTSKSKRLYYSQDAGQSWNEITDKIEKSGNAQIQVERMIVSPTDKTVAVLQANRRTRSSSEDGSGQGSSGGKWWPYVYITEDSGQNWRRAWGKRHGLHSWIAHPTQRSWALVSWWSGDCESGKGSGRKDDEEEQEEDKKPCVHRLMFTKDLGKNFLQLAEYVVQFSWGSSAVEQTNRVYFTAYRTKTGDQGRLSLWTTEVDFHYVDMSSSGRPRGSTVECQRHGNKFLVSGEFVLVAKVNDVVQQTVHLMVSKDGGRSFKAALLPSGMGELEEKWYTVLDTSEGAVILHINSNTGLKETGRVFVSDSDGYKYSQSLVDNVRSPQGECEFDKVVSLQGVYLANIVVPDGPADQGYGKAKEKEAEDVEEEAAGGSEVDQKHGRGFGGKGKAAKAAKEERTIRTVISFDKGGAWRNLKPPKVNSLGKPYDCDGKPAEQCSLHLHGTTSWDFYAPFYSSEAAIGIIMGTGNVGAMLRFEPEETSTFLSRDGGLTWLEAHRGAYIYEMGDHGGLVVMADDLKKTTQVSFSWNEGESWSDLTVSKTPFEVDNIVTEPNVTTTTFVMFGTREEGVGVIYYMKFDSLRFPACEGAWAADSVSSDYETWMPSDGASTEKCLLGQQVTYTRRKRTSQCWNGEKFERPVVKKRCSCTKEDFACDIGFTRGVNQQECVYGGSEMMPERLIPSACSKTFTVSAYRKVAGDRCEGGWKPELVEAPCPAPGLTGGSMRYALVVALCVAALCYYSRNTGGGGKPGLGDFSSKPRLLERPASLLQMPLDGVRWLSAKLSGGRGFQSYGGVTYKKVQGDEFDMDGIGIGNEDALTDFIDEAEHDDSAPHVYSSTTDHKLQRARREVDRPGILPGGMQAAREEVPRLQAPPVGLGKPAPEQFSLADSEDEDDLL